MLIMASLRDLRAVLGLCVVIIQKMASYWLMELVMAKSVLEIKVCKWFRRLLEEILLLFGI
jgi:hypothetical protein